jgi:RNA polymerase sigma-70 factor (ECF subfamily)
MVKKRIFSIVRNQEDAEDALQDTLLRAYRHLGTFRRTCKFSTWLTSIGTNTALMILRKRKTRKEAHTDVLNEESGAWETTEYVDRSLDPERQHSRHQVILVVRREVEKLRPTLRSIIKQYYGAECSLEESAKALDISVSTAKSRLTRGRKTLRWYLNRHGVSDSRV